MLDGEALYVLDGEVSNVLDGNSSHVIDCEGANVQEQALDTDTAGLLVAHFGLMVGVSAKSAAQ